MPKTIGSVVDAAIIVGHGPRPAGCHSHGNYVLRLLRTRAPVDTIIPATQTTSRGSVLRLL